MSEIKEKRLIGNTGYEVKQAFYINGKEIILAENNKAPYGQFYLVSDYVEYGIISEYSNALTSNDYLEALQEYTGRISKETAKIETERDMAGLPTELFTDEHCFPNDYSQSIEGKVVVINPEILSPEYRRGDVQLVLARSRKSGYF